jgi:uncharacterized protein (UPF0261 family)
VTNHGNKCCGGVPYLFSPLSLGRRKKTNMMIGPAKGMNVIRRNHALFPVSCNRLTVNAMAGSSVPNPMINATAEMNNVIPSYVVRLVGYSRVGAPVLIIAAASVNNVAKNIGVWIMRKPSATHQYSLLDARPVKSTYF